MLIVHISLTLLHHPSSLAIALGRFSRMYTVSALLMNVNSCCLANTGVSKCRSLLRNITYECTSVSPTVPSHVCLLSL